MKHQVKHKILSLGFVLLFLSGCSAAPNKSKIEETIVSHFEAKGYRVIDLRIGDISPIPISKKTYMGTPGYIVEVTSLTLQPVNTKENPWNHRMEEKSTFSNAQILIQRQSGPGKGWTIAKISGISMP